MRSAMKARGNGRGWVATVAMAIVSLAASSGCNKQNAAPAGGWTANSSVPGFTLTAPTGGRADVRAAGTWANGKWTVLFTRALATATTTDDVQFSGLATGTTYRFSVAVLDNAGATADATMNGQNSNPYTFGNASSTANLKAKSVTTAPTADPTDANWGTMWTKTAGSGITGTATGAAVDFRAAYDSNFVYILAEWSDATESILREKWVFDGTTWAKKSAKGSDNSWATAGTGDEQWDEDRLAIWWDISVPSFATLGCLALCHGDH